MAMGGEKPYGVKLELTMQAMRSDAQLFSETASRYLVFTSTEKSEELTKALADMNIPVEGTGLIGGRDLKITGSLKCSLPVATAYRIWNQASERALG